SNLRLSPSFAAAEDGGTRAAAIFAAGAFAGAAANGTRCPASIARTSRAAASTSRLPPSHRRARLPLRACAYSCAERRPPSASWGGEPTNACRSSRSCSMRFTRLTGPSSTVQGQDKDDDGQRAHDAGQPADGGTGKEEPGETRRSG